MSVNSAFRAILALFYVWGFLTCLNDILVPQLKFIFDLTYAQAAIVPAVFFSTCFVFASPCARLIHWLGYKRTMVTALATAGAGAFAFLPATEVSRFSWFLFALILLGMGITMLQVAAAPYVASLGPAAQAPSRFSLALGLNSLGTMCAPLFGSWLIVRNSSAQGLTGDLTPLNFVAARTAAIRHLRGPYLFLGLSMLAIAAILALTRLPSLTPQSVPSARSHQRGLLLHRPLLFGMMTCFLYAGAEIGIGSLLINYLMLPMVGPVPPRTAALLVSMYWGGATAGRFLGWSVLRRFRPEQVLALCGSAATVLVLSASISHGVLAVTSILAVGLCNSMIVPVVVMLSLSGLGHRTPQASSMLVASNIGGGLVPLAMGLLADRVGLHKAFLLPVVSYVFVLFYALNGSKGHHLNVSDEGAEGNLPNSSNVST